MNALAALIACATLSLSAVSAGAQADSAPRAAEQPNLVKQANAPLSTILQLRVVDTWAPEFSEIDGQANTVTLSVTMPLPEYRLLPFPQLSLLTMPAPATLADGTTGIGDLRFVDIVILKGGLGLIGGVGPAFVFPSASEPATGQEKWQLGPAAVIAYNARRWLAGVFVHNPVSFAGATHRASANALFLQPFATYQLGGGWFVRSQPTMVFDWEGKTQFIPFNLGGGRTFTIGRQYVSCFVEPTWTVSHDRPAPVYGVNFGISLLYPNFWNE